MKTARRFALVMVTAPNRATARRLAKLALERQMVACANLIPNIESHYWWKGSLEKSPEVLIVFKTAVASLNLLEDLIITHHPYDTPEILALNLSSGTARYLKWIDDTLRIRGKHK